MSTRPGWKKGAADWWRLRAEFESEVRTAGQDWLAAFRFTGNIARAADYADAQVLLDDANGAPVPMLKHVRQRAMMGWLLHALLARGPAPRR